MSARHGFVALEMLVALRAREFELAHNTGLMGEEHAPPLELYATEKWRTVPHKAWPVAGGAAASFLLAIGAKPFKVGDVTRWQKAVGAALRAGTSKLISEQKESDEERLV